MFRKYQKGSLWVALWVLGALSFSAGSAPLTKPAVPFDQTASAVSASSPLVWPAEPTTEALLALPLFAEPPGAGRSRAQHR